MILVITRVKMHKKIIILKIKVLKKTIF